MSKKRKTRKEKEQATLRHTVQVTQNQATHIHTASPTYTISGIQKIESRQTPKDVRSIQTNISADTVYLKHDIVAITAAAGIIAGFDILLITLLHSGIIHLNFLGY